VEEPEMGKLIQSFPNFVKIFRTKKNNALYEVHIRLVYNEQPLYMGCWRRKWEKYISLFQQLSISIEQKIMQIMK
jgi:hypothetical protein